MAASSSQVSREELEDRYVENYYNMTTDMPLDCVRYLSRIQELTHSSVHPAMDRVKQLSQDPGLDPDEACEERIQHLLTVQQHKDDIIEMCNQINDIVDNYATHLDEDRAALENFEMAGTSDNQGESAPKRRRIIVPPDPVVKSKVVQSHQKAAAAHKIIKVQQSSAKTNLHGTASGKTADAAVKKKSLKAHEVLPKKESTKAENHASTSSASSNHKSHAVNSSTNGRKSQQVDFAVPSTSGYIPKKKPRKKRQTAKKETSSQDTEEIDEPTYCLCKSVSYGDMVACDNEGCEIEWFHFKCVKITSTPKGKWYCPNCRGNRSTVCKAK